MGSDANRRQLFGSRAQRRAPSATVSGATMSGTMSGPMSGPMGSSAVGAAAEREQIESTNDVRVDGLRGRVGEMRHLALDIGAEVNAQGDLLDGLDDGMGRVGRGLDTTLANLRRLARSGGGGHMCILAVFAFLFMILVYLLLR